MLEPAGGFGRFVGRLGVRLIGFNVKLELGFVVEFRRRDVIGLAVTFGNRLVLSAAGDGFTADRIIV